MEPIPEVRRNKKIPEQLIVEEPPEKGDYVEIERIRGGTWELNLWTKINGIEISTNIETRDTPLEIVCEAYKIVFNEQIPILVPYKERLKLKDY